MAKKEQHKLTSKYVLVSTIPGHWFVRLYPTRQKAVRAARQFISEHYPEDFSSIGPGEDGVREFNDMIEVFDYFFIEVAKEGE